jgi:hypothetical protein
MLLRGARSSPTTVKRWALFFLSLLAPALLSLAVLPVWYETREFNGHRFYSETGLENQYGQATLVCALGYIALSLFRRQYLVLTSILAAVAALGATATAATQFEDWATGSLTTAYGLALALAGVWGLQSLLVFALWPEARARARRTKARVRSAILGSENQSSRRSATRTARDGYSPVGLYAQAPLDSVP